MANNVKSTLESLESQYRILISEIDDCADKGHQIKRQELLSKASVVSRRIRALETPTSDTNGGRQGHKPDWVEIENQRHNLEEKTTKELSEKSKRREYLQAIDIAQKREEEGEYTKKLTEAPPIQKSEDKDRRNKDNKLNSILQKIEEKKRLINLAQTMSGAPRSEGGISREKANKTIQLYNMDISNLEHELRELESESNNTAINIPSNTNWSLGDIIFFFIALIIFIAVILYLG